MRVSIDEIVQYVQVPQLVIDPFISKGAIKRDRRERPIHYSGGYAVVFPFDVEGTTWAFRCWSAELSNVGARLKKISLTLKKIELPYFCEFSYNPEGIVINGVKQPTTRMKWIDGFTLKDYLCNNCNNSKKIKFIADNFLTMCMQLHIHHIAHGDLQHGNIMVDNEGNLFLIDYDSLYVPTMTNEKDIIAGLPDYQHPCRHNNVFATEKLDYFSELIIYTSILAISLKPSLIDDYKIKDSDRLLFCKEDFKDIKNSRIYNDLSQLNDKIKVLLDILCEYLEHDDINELTAFEDRISESKYVTEDGIPILIGKKIFETEKTIIYEKSDDKNTVIKVFLSNIGPTKEKKIKYLASNKVRVKGVCMPKEIVLDNKGNFVGYTMSKAFGNSLSEVIFTPSKLKSTYPDWTRIELTQLAQTILETFSKLHEQNILVGNVKPDKIFFTSTDEVYFVGVDSFQVEDMLCMEGSDNVEYLSQNMNNRDVYKYKRTINDELFAISVLLYQIYLPGRHPYYEPNLSKLKERKLKFDFPYNAHEENDTIDIGDEWQSMWYDLPFDLRNVFYNTFKNGNFISVDLWNNFLLPAYLQQLENFDVTRNIFPSNVNFIIRDKSLNMNTRDIVDSRDTKLRIIKTVLKANEGTGKIGVLELSTRAVKLLIGHDQEDIKVNPFNFKQFYREAQKTNTGRGLNSANIMDMDYFRSNVLPWIIQFRETAEIQGVEYLYTVATAAYRTANNRDEIIECIREEAGVNVRILSQEEEASATIMAFRHSTRDVQKLQRSKYLMLIDAGGGSSEVSLFEGNSLIKAHSVNLGTETLRNVFFSSSSKTSTLVSAFKFADNKTKERLLTWDKHMGELVRDSHPVYCIAVGSAITKATGKKGNAKQHDTKLSLRDLNYTISKTEAFLTERYEYTNQLYRSLSYKKGKQLEELDGIFVQRLGIPVYTNILELGEVDELTVSGTGLWYGIYFEKLMEKEDEVTKEKFYNLYG